MTAPITIQPVLTTDFEEIPRLESTGFHSDMLSIAAFRPDHASPERMAIRATSLEKAFSNASAHMAKAVTSDGLIDGIIEWKFFPQGRPDDELDKGIEWPEGRQCYAGNGFASLDVLVILPEYQRGMLLREELEKADEAGIPAVLGTTVKGIRLYRKMGFVNGDVVERDLRPVEASTRHAMVMRPARKAAGTA